MTTAGLANSGILAVMALALAVLGFGGRDRAPALVPPHMPAKDRARRERSLRRGGTTCLVIAVVFALFAFIAFF